MDRRNFIKGVFGGVSAGGILIAAANTDMEAFAASMQPGHPVVAGAPDEGQSTSSVQMGEIVFNHEGRVIGVISGYSLSESMIDDTPAGAEYHTYSPGLMSYDFIVRCAGPVHLRTE